jgi:hypothetical protein
MEISWKTNRLIWADRPPLITGYFRLDYAWQALQRIKTEPAHDWKNPLCFCNII